MARYARPAKFCQTPGAAMSAIRSTVLEMQNEGYPFVSSVTSGDTTVPASYFELGEYQIYRAIILAGAISDTGDEYVWIIAVGSLGSDEDAPARFFTDSVGWSDSWSVKAPPGYYGTAAQDAAVACMSVVHGIKTSILEEWGRAVLRRSDLDGTDTSVTPRLHTYTRTSVWDVIGEQVVDVDRCCVYQYQDDIPLPDPGPDPTVFWLAAAAPQLPSGAATNFDASSIASAIDRLASRGVNASFDDGKVSVDLTSGDITTEPPP